MRLYSTREKIENPDLFLRLGLPSNSSGVVEPGNGQGKIIKVIEYYFESGKITKIAAGDCYFGH